MSSYDQGYTCIECSHSYDDRDGDLDERMCNECLDMTYEQKENMVYEAFVLMGEKGWCFSSLLSWRKGNV